MNLVPVVVMLAVLLIAAIVVAFMFRHELRITASALTEMTAERDAAVLVAGVYQAQADGATARYEAMLAAHMEQL